MTRLLPLSAALVLFAACDKDDEAAPANERADVRLAVEQAVTASMGFEAAFVAVAAQAPEAPTTTEPNAEAQVDLSPRDCGTADLSATPGTFFPATLTLAFGDACVAADGSPLGGTLVATFSGRFAEAGTRIDLTLEDYLVDGNRLSGAYAITNTGPDAEGRPTFRHTITDGEVAYPDGTTLGYDETVTSVIMGQGDATVHEDTRAATVVTAAGDTIDVATMQPLRRPVTCARAVSGRYELTTAALSQKAELDFGDGACDDLAEVTYAGETWEVRF